MILYVFDYYVGNFLFNKINLLIKNLDNYINSNNFKLVTADEIPNREGKDITKLNKEFIKLFETKIMCAAQSICCSLTEQLKFGPEYGNFVFFFLPPANKDLVIHIICDFPSNKITIWLYKDEAIRHSEKILSIKPVL